MKPKQISILHTDDDGPVNIERTAGTSTSTQEPVIVWRKDIPDPGRDYDGFKSWLAEWHAKHNPQE